MLRRDATRDAQAERADCPEPSVIAAYFDRQLPASERAKLESHLAACPRCSATLAAMLRMEPSGEIVPARRLAKTWTLVPAAALASAAVAILAIRLYRAPEETAVAPPLPIAMLEPQARVEIPERRENESAHTKGLINESNAKTSVASVPAPTPARLMLSREERVLPARHHALRAERKSEASVQAATASTVLPTPASPASIATVSPEVVAIYRTVPAPPLSDERQATRYPSPSTSPLSPAPEAVAGTGVTLGAVAGRPEAGAVIAGGLSGSSNNRNVRESASGASLAASSAIAARPLLLESPDGSTFWRIGPHGQIQRARGAGEWTTEESGVTADLLAGAAVSSNSCWVAGRDGTILRTLDGDHWSRVNSPTGLDIVHVSSSGADSATVVTVNGEKYSTADGGVSWHRG